MFLGNELFHFFVEHLNILKRLANGRKTNICDLIQPLKMPHDKLADLFRRNAIILCAELNIPLNSIHQPLKPIKGHGPFFLQIFSSPQRASPDRTLPLARCVF